MATLTEAPGLLSVSSRIEERLRDGELTQRQVTANPSDDAVYTAVISPDGTQLAYADLEGVHLRALDTGEVHNVPPSPGFCFR